MAEIGKLWAGHLYGTNTGNVAATFNSKDGAVTGEVRLNDDKYGPVVYQVAGSFDGTLLQIKGNATQRPQGVETGDITAEATLNSDGQLKGTWSSTLGTGGNFALFPHDAGVAPTASDQPPQIHTASRSLGALRIHAREMADLVSVVGIDFNPALIVVTYRDRNSEKTYYWRDFEPLFSKLDGIHYLKLFVQQPAPQGGSRSILVELDANGENIVRTSGPQESWVLGKAAAVENFLRRLQAPLVTNYRRFLNLSQILFIVTLVAMPELKLLQRVAFVFFVVLLGIAFNWLHARVFPNLAVSPSDRQSGALGRALIAIVSWLAGVGAMALAAVVAYAMTEGAPTWWR